MDEVFARAEEKITAFASTPAYREWMQERLTEAAAFARRGYRVHRCRADEPLIASLSSLFVRPAAGWRPPTISVWGSAEKKAPPD